MRFPAGTGFAALTGPTTIALVILLAGCMSQIRFVPRDQPGQQVGPWTVSCEIWTLDAARCSYDLSFRHEDEGATLADVLAAYPLVDSLRVQTDTMPQGIALARSGLRIEMRRESTARGRLHVDLSGGRAGVLRGIRYALKPGVPYIATIAGTSDTFMLRLPAEFAELTDTGRRWDLPDAPYDTLSLAAFDSLYGDPGPVVVRQYFDGPLPYAKSGLLTLRFRAQAPGPAATAAGSPVEVGILFEQRTVTQPYVR